MDRRVQPVATNHRLRWFSAIIKLNHPSISAGYIWRPACTPYHGKRGKTKMKSRLLALLLLAGGSLFAESRFSIGVGIGVPGYYPPPPPVVVYERPPCPGPDYAWVDGYWYPNGPGI